MPNSQNGWPIDPPRSKRLVPGTNTYLVVADGPAGDVLIHVAKQFNDRVEKLDGADNGGYNPRPIGNSNVPSNHWSATAIDLEWNDHPFLKRGTFSKSQVAEIRDILAEVDHVVGWGGEWSSVDAMHFEIRRDRPAVARVAARLADMQPVKGSLKIGDAGGDVRSLQRHLNRVYPSYSKLVEDGKYGPATSAVVREFQRRSGIPATGVVDAATWARLGY